MTIVRFDAKWEKERDRLDVAEDIRSAICKCTPLCVGSIIDMEISKKSAWGTIELGTKRFEWSDPYPCHHQDMKVELT